MRVTQGIRKRNCKFSIRRDKSKDQSVGGNGHEGVLGMRRQKKAMSNP